MSDRQQSAELEPEVRHYEYDDEHVVVADLGVGHEGAVDVVDGTAIVVLKDDQYELDLPAGEARAFMKNGVVTVEVDR